MEIIRHILSRRECFPHPIVSLGNFDGVHLGHQVILSKTVDEARKHAGTALVFTFHPHPLTVLQVDKPVSLILSLREKLSLIQSLGIDGVILKRFSLSFAKLSAETFVQRYLVDALEVKKVIVGHNVSFGYKRTGNAETLAQLGEKFGFAVDIVNPIVLAGIEVSSTVVRSLLEGGDMRQVARLLGRPYSVSGRVEKGFQRGRTIGFPTANLRPRADLLLPNGVYVVKVELEDGTLVPGVANVGMNPTFANKQRTVEAHLFDFSADLYGQRLRVEFLEYLRGERKFPSVRDLMKQIQEDAERARTFLLAQ
ncbi:MAG: bifunctional riboflavin kinase/FAD synthetase [Candidatus Binatia bacterium]